MTPPPENPFAPVPAFPITQVRWTSKDADHLLKNFVFGGEHGPTRPPRGIDPEYVSYWIRLRLPLDAGPIAMRRLRDLLYFYERADVLDHIGRMLKGTETTGRDIDRSCHALQIVGELGTTEQVRFAGLYFAEYIAPHREAMPYFQLLLETAEALAATVDLGVLGKRLLREIEGPSKDPNLDLNSVAAIPYLKACDYNGNDLPQTVNIVENKRRLMVMDPSLRLQEMMVIYLGESPLSTPSMVVWSGRMVRAYAMQKDGDKVVINQFLQVIEAAHRSQMKPNKKAFLIHRAGQAIQYFGGKLAFDLEEVFEAIEDGPENFLSDDLILPKYTPV